MMQPGGDMRYRTGEGMGLVLQGSSVVTVLSPGMRMGPVE